jgi:hypothetical protein
MCWIILKQEMNDGLGLSLVAWEKERGLMFRSIGRDLWEDLL